MRGDIHFVTVGSRLYATSVDMLGSGEERALEESFFFIVNSE